MHRQPVLIGREACLYFPILGAPYRGVMESRSWVCPGFAKRAVCKAGAYSGGEMPVPIPNTEAKPARADGTGARPGAGRAGRCRPHRQRARWFFCAGKRASRGTPAGIPGGAFFIGPARCAREKAEGIDMRISKEDKKALAEELGAELKAKGSFFATFSGMKFADANGLREALRPAKARFRVARNAVVSHALGNAGLRPEDGTVAKGPTALVTMEDAEEITRVARELVRFAKDHPGISWKGGFSEGRWVSPEDMEKLSRIGTRPEVLGQLAGALYSAVAQIRYVLDSLKDLKEKQEAEKSPAA